MDRIREYRIPIILAVAAVLFLSLFICDYTRRSGIGSREEIGSITYKRRGVMRRFADQVVWEKIDQGTQLANADTIRTDEKSETRVTLKDGTVLTIDESSMVKLDLLNRRIDFQQGSVQVQSTSGNGLTVKSGDSEIQTDNGSVTLQKTDKDLSVTVHEGSAQVTSGGRTENVGKNQKAEVGQQGIQVKDLPVVLLKPNPFQTMATEGDGTRVAFRFEPNNQVRNPVLEVSKDPDFKDARRVETPGNARVELAPGTYYWRVTAEDVTTSQKAVSETRKVTILRGEPLRLHSPATGEGVAFFSQPPAVPFAWSADPLAAEYEVEVAKDAMFKDIVKSLRTTSSSVTIDGLEEGLYHWRIRTTPNQPDSPARVSPTGEFRVYRTDLAAPETISPFENENFAKLQADEGVLFNWRGAAEMTRFAVQIADSPAFATSILSKTYDRNFVPVKGLKDGLYYWRVKGITAAGKESPYSPVRRFSIGPGYMKSEFDALDQIKPIFPVRTAVDMTGRKALEFRWEAAAGAKSYTFRLYRNDRGVFTPILTQVTQGPSFILGDLKIVDVGNFAWDVQADGGDKKPTGRVDFSITLSQYLRSLRPGDIHLVNPDTVYREENGRTPEEKEQ
jgi:hypothetical protein